jgi:septation ring formation regulator EzrA
MKVSTEVAEAIDATREILQKVVISLDSLSERVDEIASEIGRIKDVQNELLGSLSLYERVKRFKEDYLGLELKPSTAEEIDWDNMKAYCNNCTKMVHIIEPTSTLKNGRMTVRAKCKICGTSVFRNSS